MNGSKMNRKPFEKTFIRIHKSANRAKNSVANAIRRSNPDDPVIYRAMNPGTSTAPLISMEAIPGTSELHIPSLSGTSTWFRGPDVVERGSPQSSEEFENNSFKSKFKRLILKPLQDCWFWCCTGHCPMP